MKRNARIIHMPEEQFWHGNPQDFFLYCDVYEFEQKQIDRNNWSCGLYFLYAQRQALSECLSKNTKKIYPEKPFTEQQEIKQVARNSVQERILNNLLKKKSR